MFGGSVGRSVGPSVGQSVGLVTSPQPFSCTLSAPNQHSDLPIEAKEASNYTRNLRSGESRVSRKSPQNGSLRAVYRIAWDGAPRGKLLFVRVHDIAIMDVAQEIAIHEIKRVWVPSPSPAPIAATPPSRPHCHKRGPWPRGTWPWGASRHVAVGSAARVERSEWPLGTWPSRVEVKLERNCYSSSKGESG